MKWEWISSNWEDWNRALQQVHQSNWMQSWPYACAVRKRDFKTSRMAILMGNFEDGQDEVLGELLPIGLVIVQEIKLGPINILEISRGPLWFCERNRNQKFLSFARSLVLQFPHRILRRLRWLPEINIEPNLHQDLLGMDFHPLPQTFETAFLDLTPSIEELRKGLHPKWRNALNQSEKMGLLLRLNEQGPPKERFLNYNEQFRAKKGFMGPSSAFLLEEISEAQKFRESLLLWAYQDLEPVAGIYILLHGKSAFYRLGWNTPRGRATKAHYFLIWQTITLLKRLSSKPGGRNLHFLDLGGIKSLEHSGGAHFKLGTGARYQKNLGIYR